MKNLNNTSKNGSKDEPIPGLRDFFASSALSCLAADQYTGYADPEELAKYCYKVSDAMLKERNKLRAQ
jgi:hypothetical protein